MLRMAAAAAATATADDQPAHAPPPACPARREHALLESERWFDLRGEQRQRVGSFGELVDERLAAGAAVDVHDRLGALGASEHPERELRRDVTQLRTRVRTHSARSSVTSAIRKRWSAVRIRVFAVPSGMSSISPTSRAV